MLEAEEALTRALEIDPEHLKARLNLARVLLDAGRPQRRCLRRAR